jgi:general L-amino acid transport system substrate-binding protein
MTRLMKIIVVAALMWPGGEACAQTLDAVRSSQRLICGTVQNADDWNGEDEHGDLSALGGEICRAVAVAILGRSDGLTVRPYPSEQDAVAAVKSGAVQLAVGVTPSTETAVRYGVAFGPPVFFDTQRIMVSRQSAITQLSDLRDRLICALDMTQSERTLRDELDARGIPFALMTHSEQGEMDAAIAVDRCAAGTAMETRLAQSRANFHARASDFHFLPDRFALSPIAPVYRYGDQAFGLVVEWTISALIEAESLGVAKSNVGDASARTDMRAERLLGRDFATAQALGLAHDWAAKVVASVGNYGEIYQRTVGVPYRLDRGLNALWTEGGLMAPMPMK